MNEQRRANHGFNNLVKGLAQSPAADLNFAEWGDALPTLKQLVAGNKISGIIVAGALWVSGCGAAPQPPQGSIQPQASEVRGSAQYFGVPTPKPEPDKAPDIPKPLPLPTPGPQGTPQGATQKGDPRAGALPTAEVNRVERLPGIQEHMFPPGFGDSILFTRMKTHGVNAKGSGVDPGPDDPKSRFKLQNIRECEAQISRLILRARQSPAQYYVADTTCVTHEGNSYYFSARYISDLDTLEVSVSSTNLPTSQSWHIQNTSAGTTLWISSYAIFSTPQGPVRDTGFNPADDTVFVLGIVQKSTGQKIDTVRASVFDEGGQYGMHSNYNKFIYAYEAARVSGRSPQAASMEALKSIFSMGIVANRVAVLNRRNVPIEYTKVSFQLADNRIVTPNELKAEDKITAIFATADVSAKK